MSEREPQERGSRGPDRAQAPFRLGDWQVDPVPGTLSRGEETGRLEPKVMAVLVELARDPGAVCSKESLIDAVWADTFVGEAALSRCISELRRVLGDDARNPSYIETLPRRGYRLVARVEPGVASGAQHGAGASADSGAESEPVRPRLNRWIALGLVVVMLGLWWRMRPEVDPADLTVESVAVLPLRDLSDAAAGPRFAEALTAQLNAALSGVEGLSVVSEASARAAVREGRTLRQIAAELGVDAVVDGTVQIGGLQGAGGTEIGNGQRVLISLELVHAATDFHLWAGSFQEDGEDLLEVEREVAEQAVREMAAALAARGDSHRLEPPVSGAARDLLLQGRTLALRETPADLLRALDYYGQALELEPDYALAWASIADARATMAWHGWSSAEEGYGEARTAAYRALDLRPTLAEALATLAAIAAEARWDWPEAERLFRDAIARDPRSVFARERYARYLLRLGRTGEALGNLERALEIDGRDLGARTTRARALLLNGRPEEAVDELLRLLELDDDLAPAVVALCDARNRLDDARAAVGACRRAASMPGYELERAALGIALGRAGEPEQARELLDALERDAGSVPDAQLAVAALRLALGDREGAIAAVQAAFSARAIRASAIAGDPYLQPLLQEPGLRELLERALPEAPR